jgi:hypothetical protein
MQKTRPTQPLRQSGPDFNQRRTRDLDHQVWAAPHFMHLPSGMKFWLE